MMMMNINFPLFRNYFYLILVSQVSVSLYSYFLRILFLRQGECYPYIWPPLNERLAISLNWKRNSFQCFSRSDVFSQLKVIIVGSVEVLVHLQGHEISNSACRLLTQACRLQLCCLLFSTPLINPLNAELNPICCLLALLAAHHFLHVSRIRVKSLTLRLLMSYIYIYGAPILDVSRSHTTTHHSR